MSVYKTGSVTVKPGSASVTGHGTKFLTYVNSGDYFKLPKESTWYEVATVNSNTSLVLTSRYANTVYNIARSSNIASTNNATKIYSGTLTYTPVIQNYVVINASNVRYTDNGAGVLTGTPVIGTPVGTIDYDTGAWSINTATTYAASVNVSASYYSGLELANVGYNILTDFTTNKSLPEMSTNDSNFQAIYTKAIRLIDSALYNVIASSVTASHLTASGLDIVAHVNNTASDPHSVVDDTAYSSSWNGSGNIAPSKNSVYDKIELVVASINTVDGNIDTHAADTSTHGVTGTILGTEDVDDTPVNGVTNYPVSSNWAYDHINDADQHSEYMQKSDNLSDVASAVTAFGNIKQAATDSSTGVVELATTSETNTGTDTGRAVTPDGLAGSIHGEKSFVFVPFESDTNVGTGDGTVGFVVPASMNGMNIVAVVASITGTTAGDGSTIDVQIRRRRGGSDVDVLSTKCTIDASEWTSDDAATPPVVNSSNDDLETGDVIFCDVDQARSGTAGVGLGVVVTARLP